MANFTPPRKTLNGKKLSLISYHFFLFFEERPRQPKEAEEGTIKRRRRRTQRGRERTTAQKTEGRSSPLLWCGAAFLHVLWVVLFSSSPPPLGGAWRREKQHHPKKEEAKPPPLRSTNCGVSDLLPFLPICLYSRIRDDKHTQKPTHNF